MTAQYKPTQSEISTSLLRWDDTSDYEPGFFIGSCGHNDEHVRNVQGWPFSIYRAARAPGRSDVVICGGIQSLYDAHQILDRLDCLA